MMSERELREIEEKDSNGLFPETTWAVLKSRQPSHRSNATVGEVRALIAELRRLRGLVHPLGLPENMESYLKAHKFN